MENNAKMRIQSEMEVTVDFVVEEGNQIWSEFRRRKIDIQNETATQELLDWARKNHSKFYSSYPIVCRYICQLGEYREKALRRWITKVKNNPWKTETEYLDAQTDYVCILYNIVKPRANLTDKRNLRTNIRNMLQQEHERFKQIGQEAQDEVTAQQIAAKKQIAAELRDFVTTHDMSDIGTVRVEADPEIKDVNTLPINRGYNGVAIGGNGPLPAAHDNDILIGMMAECSESDEICADDLLG